MIEICICEAKGCEVGYFRNCVSYWYIFHANENEFMGKADQEEGRIIKAQL